MSCIVSECLSGQINCWFVASSDQPGKGATERVGFSIPRNTRWSSILYAIYLSRTFGPGIIQRKINEVFLAMVWTEDRHVLGLDFVNTSCKNQDRCWALGLEQAV